MAAAYAALLADCCVESALGTGKRSIPALVDKLRRALLHCSSAATGRDPARGRTSARKQVERDRSRPAIMAANRPAFRLRQYDCIGFDMVRPH